MVSKSLLPAMEAVYQTIPSKASFAAVLIQPEASSRSNSRERSGQLVSNKLP
jgi:hypothetical protein